MRRREPVIAVVAVVAIVVGVVLIVTSGGSQRAHPRALPAPAPAASLRPALPAPPGQAFGLNVNRLFNDMA